jgi:hypothetical protein
MKIQTGLAALCLVLLSACGGGTVNTPQARSTKLAASAPAAQSTFAFSGYKDEYQLQTTATGLQVTHTADGKVTTLPSTINTIRFDDITITFAATAEEIYRLYRAAFDRIPDPSGLGFWLDALQRGVKIEEIASAMAGSNEFALKNGSNVPPSVFITNLYANILHRAPDASGLNFWVESFKNGVPKEQILLAFAQSGENVSQVAKDMLHGVAIAMPGVAYRPVAETTQELSGIVGTPVYLDGTLSRDANNDGLTFAWTFQPTADSSVILQNPATAKPSFTPDRPGEYKATLIVRDGQFESLPRIATIKVTAPVVSPIADTGIYKCSSLSAAQALSLFYQGHTYLDRDHDGKPCEDSDKLWESSQTSNATSPHMCWVNGYRRSNGTYVSGYWRRC